MKHLPVLFLSVGLALLVTACAIGDVPATPAPPITLEPPPTLVFEGDCETTRDLESWLQKTSFMKQDFLQLVDEAASTAQGDLFAIVQRMANKRDSASLVPVPDCAIEAHLLLVDAMTRAVAVFQAYNNADREDWGNIVEDTKKRMAMIDVIQLELTDRLEAQYANP